MDAINKQATSKYRRGVFHFLNKPAPAPAQHHNKQCCGTQGKLVILDLRGIAVIWQDIPPLSWHNDRPWSSKFLTLYFSLSQSLPPCNSSTRELWCDPHWESGNFGEGSLPIRSDGWTINGCILHHSHNRKESTQNTMEINIKGVDGQTYVVDVDVDDTAKDLRRKVATAAGFAEDSFGMIFGGNDEGEDITITALSAGDTVLLTQTQTKKQEAIAALRALGETDLTPKRLVRVKDPKVVQLFLQAEVVTATPKSLLASTTLTGLDLSAPLAITAIGDCFLFQCSSLKSVDLSGLSNVTHVGNYFLADCAGLTSINFAGLSNVTSLGDSFLSNCRSLASINFAGLGGVTNLGSYFLRGCTSLTSIDFARLSSVTSLGDSFLSNCRSLTSINFAGLGEVTNLRNCFLRGCTSLTSIDFARLGRVTSLGYYFLRECKALTSIDFAGLGNVASLGHYFLCECKALTSIDFAGLGRVTSLGHHFLCDCKALASVDFAGLSGVTRIDSCFLEGCVSLKNIHNIMTFQRGVRSRARRVGREEER